MILVNWDGSGGAINLTRRRVDHHLRINTLRSLQHVESAFDVSADVREWRLVRVGNRNQRGEMEDDVDISQSVGDSVGIANVTEHDLKIVLQRRLVEPAP